MGGLHILFSRPKAWKDLTAVLRYRGKRFDIIYKNESGLNVVLTVDGRGIEGNVVPLFGNIRLATLSVLNHTEMYWICMKK